MRDDKAQMMLLTAVILLIGFVALAGMVARVSQLPEETIRESRDPILAQVENVEIGLQLILEEAESVHPLATQNTEHEVFLEEAADYMRQILTSRGYVATITVACTQAGVDAVVSLEAELARGAVLAQMKVAETYTSTFCWPA